MAVRYEAGSLRILPARALRALGWLNLAFFVTGVGLVLAGGDPWILLVALPWSVPLATTQVRFDERGVHWRPARFAALPTPRGLQERTVAWPEIVDLELDYRGRRLVLTADGHRHELSGLTLPDPQPDRDLLESFIERHRSRFAHRIPARAAD